MNEISEKIREHILRVPRLYIGHEWNSDGLHFLITEVIKLAVEPETMNGASVVMVTTEPMGAISIKDNGKGLPIEPISLGSSNKLSPLEHVLTDYMPTKKGQDYYHAFGFLNYLGTVMCVVAKQLIIETVQGDILYTVTCSQGKIVERIKKTANTMVKGTRITFLPDPQIFLNHTFSNERLNQSLLALTVDYPTVEFVFNNKSVN